MKKEYTSPTMRMVAYRPQPTIANGSTVDGEFDLMDALSPQTEI